MLSSKCVSTGKVKNTLTAIRIDSIQWYQTSSKRNTIRVLNLYKNPDPPLAILVVRVIVNQFSHEQKRCCEYN